MKYYVWYLILCSVVSFFAYGIDKYKAQNGKWRISEKFLLGISFFGGGVGGYLAMQLFRHKTKHWYFHAVHILAIAWQVALLIVLI